MAAVASVGTQAEVTEEAATVAAEVAMEGEIGAARDCALAVCVRWAVSALQAWRRRSTRRDDTCCSSARAISVSLPVAFAIIEMDGEPRGGATPWARPRAEVESDRAAIFVAMEVRKGGLRRGP